MQPEPRPGHVPRETRDRLGVYVRELVRWQAALNLVGPRTLDDVWNRHVEDSLQLLDWSDALTWADLGSGGGLPGLVLAIGRPDSRVCLLESDGRKCAFLRHVARLLAPNAEVIEGRIADTIGQLDPVQAVTARGLAPLRELLALAAPQLERGATGLFLKGKQHAAELTLARESWTFAAELIESRTDRDGRIVRVSDFRGRRGA